MKEHPILFSAPMVRAILEGRKTQTRRVIALSEFHKAEKPGVWYFRDKKSRWQCLSTGELAEKCPYGKPGHLLWVRETFTNSEPIYYRATLPEWLNDSDYIWKPSIFMPREFSRITLEITNIRVERIQDISELDARAEGIVWQRDFGDGLETRDARVPFGDLWNAINDPRGFGWNVNPWVWVIEFQRAGLIMS